MAGHAAQDIADEDKTALVRLLYLSTVVTPSKVGATALGDWMALHGLGEQAAPTEAEREAEWLARDAYWFMADGPATAETEDARDG